MKQNLEFILKPDFRYFVLYTIYLFVYLFTLFGVDGAHTCVLSYMCKGWRAASWNVWIRETEFMSLGLVANVLIHGGILLVQKQF